MLTIKDGLLASALAILNQLTRRLMGIVSLIILARVLTPEDFGLVAIALIFLNFVQVITNIGSRNYLMSRETIDNDMVFTSWTLGFCIKNTVGIGLAIASPFIAAYYDDARLTPIILAFALQIFIGTLGSPGMIYKHKNQQLKEITRWQILSRFVTTGITIAIAVIYETYWALVIGQLSITVSHVISTYVIAPMKPKPTFKNVKPQWQFSKWILPQSLINFFRSQIDAIYVSSIFDKPTMGAYNSMRYYATIPGNTFIQPILSPTLAQFSQFKNNLEYYKKQVQVAFFGIFALSSPIVLLMTAQSEYLVQLMLGEKWVEYSQLLGIFSFFTLISVINNAVSQITMLKDNTQYLLFYSVIATLSNAALFFAIDFTTIFQLAAYKIGLDLVLSFVFFVAIVGFLLGAKTLINVSYPIIVVFLCIFVGYFSASLLPHYANDTLYFFAYCGIAMITYFGLLLCIVWLFKDKVHCYQYTFKMLDKSIKLITNKLR